MRSTPMILGALLLLATVAVESSAEDATQDQPTVAAPGITDAAPGPAAPQQTSSAAQNAADTATETELYESDCVPVAPIVPEYIDDPLDYWAPKFETRGTPAYDVPQYEPRPDDHNGAGSRLSPGGDGNRSGRGNGTGFKVVPVGANKETRGPAGDAAAPGSRDDLNMSHLQHYTYPEGADGTLNGAFKVKCPDLANGEWPLEHGCCNGHWWEIHRRWNPRVEWTGTPIGTLSLVIIADDIDANARVHWVVFNIHPHEYTFGRGMSGHHYSRDNEKPWSREMYNRWGNWRFTAFCSPKHEIHRFRVRVFAQRDWDQNYVNLGGQTSGHRNADDIVSQLMPQNLAVDTVVGVFQRPSNCGGPQYDAEPGSMEPLPGLIADYDAQSQTLMSTAMGAPELLDLGAQCGFSARFVDTHIRHGMDKAIEFNSGAGFAIPDIDLLVKKGQAYSYSVFMDVKIHRVNYWVRMMNVNPGHDYGWYLGYTMKLYPTIMHGGRSLRHNTWHQMVITVNATKNPNHGRVDFFLDGDYMTGGHPGAHFDKSVGIRSGIEANKRMGTGFNKLNDAPYMSFFNDCGKDCLCSGGGGENSGGMMRRLQLYNRILTGEEIRKMYETEAYKKGSAADIEYYSMAENNGG